MLKREGEPGAAPAPPPAPEVRRGRRQGMLGRTRPATWREKAVCISYPLDFRLMLGEAGEGEYAGTIILL